MVLMTRAGLEFAKRFTELPCGDPDSAGEGLSCNFRARGRRKTEILKQTALPGAPLGRPAGCRPPGDTAGPHGDPPAGALLGPLRFPFWFFGGEGPAPNAGGGPGIPQHLRGSRGHTCVAVGCWSQPVSQEEPHRLFIPISSVFTQGLPCAPAACPGSHVTFSLPRAMAVSQTCLVLGDLDPFKEDWAGVSENVPQLGRAWWAAGLGGKLENKPSWMSSLTSG